MIEDIIYAQWRLGVAPWDVEYLWDLIDPETKEQVFTQSIIKPEDISTPQHSNLDKQVFPRHIGNNNKVTEFSTSNLSIKTQSIEIIHPQNDDQDDKGDLETSKDESLNIKEIEQEISQSRDPKRSVVKVSYNTESLLKDDRFLNHSHTKSSQVKPFRCTICDYKCDQKTNLKKHLLTHTGEKTFQCSICDYKSNYKHHLKSHVLNHTGEALFQCAICDFRCNYKHNLKSHVLTHTGEKLFQCDICDYRCNYKQNLKSHVLTHTGEKPFQCTICDYRCNTRSNIKTHLLTHTGEKTFQCTMCDYRSNRKCSLIRHMKIHNRDAK